MGGEVLSAGEMGRGENGWYMIYDKSKRRRGKVHCNACSV